MQATRGWKLLLETGIWLLALGCKPAGSIQGISEIPNPRMNCLQVEGDFEGGEGSLCFEVVCRAYGARVSLAPYPGLPAGANSVRASGAGIW